MEPDLGRRRGPVSALPNQLCPLGRVFSRQRGNPLLGQRVLQSRVSSGIVAMPRTDLPEGEDLLSREREIHDHWTPSSLGRRFSAIQESGKDAPLRMKSSVVPS